MSRISISIVLYHTCTSLLNQCLAHYQQALAQLPASVTSEVYLVNNSHVSDGQAIQQWLADFLATNAISCPVHYIAAPKNGGYGYGHNIAIWQSTAHYHVVSNADIFVAIDSLVCAYTYMEQHLDVGLLSPDVYDLEGKRCYLCKQSPSLLTAVLRRLPKYLMNRWFARILADFENRHLDYDQEISDYDFATGCWMFFRMADVKKIGGFDEGYFMYCEDADIGRRLKSIARMVYVPQVKCCHVWQRASKHSLPLLWVHLKSILRYQRKFKHNL